MKAVRSLIFLIFGLAVLLLIINQVSPQGNIFSLLSNTTPTPSPSSSPSIMVEAEDSTSGVTLMAPAGESPADSMVRNQISLPQAEVLTYDQPAEQAVNTNTTALNLLQTAAAEHDLELKIQTYDFGSFVSGIGKVSGNSEFSWLYYINGESAQVGADQYTLQPGDLIEWKYEVLE